jgi:hypothetical protein
MAGLINPNPIRTAIKFTAMGGNLLKYEYFCVILKDNSLFLLVFWGDFLFGNRQARRRRR